MLNDKEIFNQIMLLAVLGFNYITCLVKGILSFFLNLTEPKINAIQHQEEYS